MTVTIALAELTDAGITVGMVDGRLRLSAKPGAMSPELRDRIRASRAGLVLEAARLHLLALAAGEGLPADLVQCLPDADVAACEGYTDAELLGYLRALVARQRMDGGMVPLEWGGDVAGTCEGCGPVLLWPGSPERVTACPWCFRRRVGKAIPRPSSKAGTPTGVTGHAA